MPQAITSIGTLSEVRRLFSWWRVVFPFQSFLQFQSWVFMVVSVTALFLLAVRVLEGHPIAPEILLLFGAAGALPSAESVLPGQMDISSKIPQEALKSALHDALLHAGYKIASDAPATRVYRQDLPRLLRWNEGELSLTFLPSGASITGAIGAIVLLRMTLTKHHASDISQSGG